MQCIGTALNHHVDGATAIAPELRGAIAGDGKLIDGIDGQNGSGNARNAALVHCR